MKENSNNDQDAVPTNATNATTNANAKVSMDKKIFAPSNKVVTVNNNFPSSDSSTSSNKVSSKQDAVGWGLGRGRRRGSSTAPDTPFGSSRSSSSSGGPHSSRPSPQRNQRTGGSKGRAPSTTQHHPTQQHVNGRGAAEVGSLQAPGAKKREWDNLFYFAPRDRTSSSSCVWKSHHAHRGRNESGGSGGLHHKSKFSKENFLRANCQFMVKANGNDYAPYLADPDLLVEWSCVEQIVVTMIGEGASCPICLGPPVAAKITRCGHIYCWSCILHYLALSDNASRPCPICYEAICSKDLKSVVAHVHFDVELGDVIEMELLRRQKEVLSVVPLHAHEATSEWNELYSKVLLISPFDVMEKVIDREHKELTIRLEEDPHCPEVCFLHQAIRELSERKNSLAEEGDKKQEINKDLEKGDGLGGSVASSPVQVCLPTGEQDDCFYFYQDAKGLNIFLHPLNFSMLLKEFGTEMTDWPRYLSFRVIDKEYYSACEETRKRWKFLRHLPLSTPFIIIEADLDEFISPEVMTEFSTQIAYRQNRRENRAKEEKKMEKIIAERERKLWKIPVVPQFEPRLDFPEFLETDTTPELVKSIETPSSDDGLAGLGAELSDRIGSTTSFAQMASRAPSQMKKSPSFPLGGPSNTWGKGLGGVSPQRPTGPRRHSDSEPEPDDYVAVPEFRASVSDAISKALESIVFEETSSVGSSNAQRKKKKGKGKVLFATGGTGSFN